MLLVGDDVMCIMHMMVHINGQKYVYGSDALRTGMQGIWEYGMNTNWVGVMVT